MDSPSPLSFSKVVEHDCIGKNYFCQGVDSTKFSGRMAVIKHMEMTEMTWILEFDAPVGRRVMSGFTSVTAFGSDIWWHHDLQEWGPYNLSTGSKSSHHSAGEGAPRTVRAFTRYLRKHSNLKGFEVVLCNKFVSDTRLDVTAKWESK